MEKSLGVFFYLKKPRNHCLGPVPVYMRLTVNGIRSEISVKQQADPPFWNATAGRATGKTDQAKSLNQLLDILQRKVYEARKLLMDSDQPVTAENIKIILTGRQVNHQCHTLAGVFQKHNDQIRALVGREYAAGTLERYTTSLKHTVDFLNWKYKVSDIDIRKIDHDFIMDYEFYLRSVRKCGNNSAVKYIKNFGKIIRICLANGWIEKNPFANYKAKVKEVKRVFLDEQEIHTLLTRKFGTERLNQVRDIFLFSCFTGLAYIDVKQLTRHNIVTGIDGEKWIHTSRQKTDTASHIPLLPVAEQIISKYEKHPLCVETHRLLPVASNQKMNAYLKEMADVCGITKELTFHIARHTFATTVTLTNGVSIESVSKMLGHKNLRTTQHYAKILDSKVSMDMKLLKSKNVFSEIIE
jgi:site-specific recombinase XerD